jgi:quinol monooxygenase YgiN
LNESPGSERVSEVCLKAKEDKEMIVIRFKVQCQPNRTEEALSAFAAVVPPSRAVEGVISFDIGRDVVDPNSIVAVEVFEDEAARERQESLPEVRKVMSLFPEILAGPPEARVFQVASSADAFAAA